MSASSALLQVPRGLRVALLLFADDVVLMASSGCGLQGLLGWFAAKCQGMVIRVGTSKSESMDITWKKVYCTLVLQGKLLSREDK